MARTTSLFVLSALALASSLTTACSSSPAEEEEDAQVDDAAVIANTTGAPKMCAAIRGNGEYIVTHFASLARITEHYGVVDGVAGGSSGSITSFVYESILKNPSVSKCGTKKCTDAKKAARVSLALKSLQGYGMTVASSEEGVAIANLVGIAGKLKKEVDDRGIGALVSTDATQAAVKLKEVLEIPEVKGLVNPEIFAMLRDVAHLEYNVKEIHTSIATLGAFSVDDNRLFFRPGVLNWDALSMLFGRVADFYAGYEGTDRIATAAWLDACADASVGKPWEEASSVPFPSGGSCGEAFMKLASDYRTKVRGSNAAPKRLSERVGDASPLRKLISTSVLEDAAVPAYKAGRTAYLSGAHPTGNIPFDVKFDDIKFGYWGSDADTAAALADRKGYGDLKTKKATSLGNSQWKEILKASPAEPGLSRFVELPDGRISAGGWSDLAPVLALKNMGCERVVYITREGDESGFATKIAKHLGMNEAGWKSLYDLGATGGGKGGGEASSFNVSLEKADGVWCTNWNSFTSTQQRELAADSWKAPLEARATFAGIRELSPYPNKTDRTGKVGCTPGISGGGTFPTD